MVADRSSRARVCEVCEKDIAAGELHRRSPGGCYYHTDCTPVVLKARVGPLREARVNDVHLHATDPYRLVLRHWKGERR